MALPVDWYDFICFGIVGASFLGSVWVLWRKEGTRHYSRSSSEEDEDDDTTFFHSLLSGRRVGSLGGLPAGRVGSAHMWSGCWKGVHPGWLFGTRLISFLVMAGFLTRDVVNWGASIYVYYTEDLWSSKWRNFTNPIWLFLYRAFALICLARVSLLSLALDGVFAFYFYTQWTFTLVMVYFAIGTVISGYGCWAYSAGKSGPENGFRKLDVEATNGAKLRRLCSSEEEIIQRAGFWGYLMQTIYQASAGAVVITDIMFWCVIVPFLSTERLSLNLLNGCMHSLNAVFLLIDTALNSLPFPWFRLAYFVLWTCSYVVFQWVLHACGFSWWPYPFMELDTPWAPLWYFALALFHIPCYGIYAMIVKAKNTVLPRMFPRAFLRSS